MEFFDAEKHLMERAMKSMITVTGDGYAIGERFDSLTTLDAGQVNGIIGRLITAGMLEVSGSLVTTTLEGRQAVVAAR